MFLKRGAEFFDDPVYIIRWCLCGKGFVAKLMNTGFCVAGHTVVSYLSLIGGIRHML